MKKLPGPIALLSVVCLLPLAVGAAPAGFDDGVKAYNARQYANALARFQQAARVAPTDPLTHYYMGLSYQGLNQFSLAKQQYEYVYATSKNNGLRASCSAALASLSRYQSQKITGSGYAIASASAGRAGGGGGVRASGRLKVIEFYADW